VDGDVLGILGFVFLFIVLDVAALRFGCDSRRWVREMPFGFDAVISLPGAGRQLRRRWRIAPQHEPMISPRPWHQPLRPYLPRPVFCHGLDLAAAGK
jgi:hypothetical protein